MQFALTSFPLENPEWRDAIDFDENLKRFGVRLSPDSYLAEGTFGGCEVRPVIGSVENVACFVVTLLLYQNVFPYLGVWVRKDGGEWEEL